jgi:hypothetical protein
VPPAIATMAPSPHNPLGMYMSDQSTRLARAAGSGRTRTYSGFLDDAGVRAGYSVYHFGSVIVNVHTTTDVTG